MSTPAIKALILLTIVETAIVAVATTYVYGWIVSLAAWPLLAFVVYNGVAAWRWLNRPHRD